MTINCPINSLAFSTLSSFFPPLFSPFSNVSPSAREACGDTLSADQFYTNLDRLNRDQPREVIISRSILFESFSFFEPIKNGERREEMLSIKNIANATRIFKEYVHCRQMEGAKKRCYEDESSRSSSITRSINCVSITGGGGRMAGLR